MNSDATTQPVDPPQAPLRVIRLIVAGSLLLSAALALVWARTEPGSTSWTIATICIALAAALPLLAGWMHGRGLPTTFLVAVAAVNGVLVVPELALRANGAVYESRVQFGYPRGRALEGFQSDPELFWRFPPGGRFNSLGFLGEELSPLKADGVFRAVFLGDSCTWQGYPEIAEALANAHPIDPITRVESISLAVPGYSTHQGAIVAEKYASSLNADVAFVYFGWNDHWLAYGAIDADKSIEARPASGPVASLFARSRLLQAGRSLRTRISGGANTRLDEVRVPVARYRENLERIHASFERRGVPVVFVTAPTSHAALGVPDYLVTERYATDDTSVLRLHRDYNQIVRSVAAERSAELLDLERRLVGPDDLALLFKRDGIHFTPAGNAVVADAVRRVIESRMDESVVSPR